jgi:hypothetical protein
VSGRRERGVETLAPLESSVKEAARVLQEAESRKVTIRLLGGLAFYFRCPSAKNPNLTREYGDLDVIGHLKESRGIKTLFAELGYTPRARFNALQGQRRLIFEDEANRRRVDIFLDIFEMCHKFDFSKRLEVDHYTLPLADLLVTKLQIVEINTKDIKDVLSLLLDYEVGTTDVSQTNGEYISKLCGSDWGFYRTFTANLDKLLVQAEGCGLTETEQKMVAERIGKLKEMIEAAPKSTGWKMRARVGDRVRWYELPEET